MEIKEAKIISLWQNGVKIGESILEEKTIPERSPAYACPFCGANAIVILRDGYFRYCPNCGKRVVVDWG